jgi:alpha-1,4-digalacturonate transport system permease protein
VNTSLLKRLTPYLFVAPNTIIFSVFVLLPMIFGLGFSLFDGDFTTGLHHFGFQNYARLFQDNAFLEALLNTFWYVTAVVILNVAISLALAVMLRQTTLGTALARVGFYIPVILSPVVIGVAWRFMFGELGIVNALIGNAGGTTIPFFTEPAFARLLVVLASVWAGVGASMVIFIGGLNTIAPELYEAASIDGAVPSVQFWKITLPLLTPTIVLVTTLGIINAFKAFEVLLVLTNGGPGTTTKLLVQKIYQTAFDETNPTYASAMSVVLFLILMILTAVQSRFSRND